MTSKDTSKPSTTIEAQIDDIFEEYGLGNTTLASEKGIVAARSKLLKAIEAEKLKGHIMSSKRLIMYTAMVIVVTAMAASYASSKASVIPTSDNFHEECQYPTRPYVDGHCDNADPVDPTKTKEDYIEPNLEPQPEQKANMSKNTCQSY